MKYGNTEVVILSGFLGSGKTTLLKQMLQLDQQKSKKVAVLMNEFGQVSIDSNAVSEDIPLKELLNGCICCTIQDQLMQQIASLCQMHKPDRIYIEATGVAHPLEVQEACLDPIVAPYLRSLIMITTVDGCRFLDRSLYSAPIRTLMEEQVRFADVCIVNRRSECTYEQLNALQEQIKFLNSHANCFITDYSSVPTQILEMKDLSSLAYLHPDRADTSIEHLRVKSFTYTFSYPIDRERFYNWLRKAPDTLYRVKGYLRFCDDPKQTILFQFSYGMPQLQPETFPYPCTIVFIGEDLPIEEMRIGLQELEVSTDCV